MSNWTENERLVGLVVLRLSTPRSSVLLTGDRRRGRSRCAVLTRRSLRPVVTHLDPDLRRDLQRPFLARGGEAGRTLLRPTHAANPSGPGTARFHPRLVWHLGRKGGAPLRHDALRHCACLSSFQRPMESTGDDDMTSCRNALMPSLASERLDGRARPRKDAPSNRPSCPRLFPTTFLSLFLARRIGARVGL